ncbi:MAG: putative DNA-binding domain-containing protein [bacterium]|nr:putative DNA-binding domain-containing protein [bacterium]
MPAPVLRDLQAGFFRAVTRGEAEPDLVAVVGATAALDALDAMDRLGIYAGMYVMRLEGVLAADFPRLAAALGHDPFAAVVRGYLAEHPSEHPSVRHVGRRLAAWLAGTTAPVDLPPWAADLAALEWARVEAFDVPDEVPIRLADLAVLPPGDWPGLRFRPVASLRRLASHWPVDRLWAEPEVMPAPHPTAVRVWRQDHVVYHCAVERAEDLALARLVAGEPFASVCEAFAEVGDDGDGEAAAARAGSHLVRWLEDGLIAGRR